MSKKKSLITGAGGQDALWLVPLLLEKGYEVHVTDRRRSDQSTQMTAIIKEQIHMHEMDLTDVASINRVFCEIMPDEVYNLAAQSHVGWSFKVPEQTMQTNAFAVLHMLETIRTYMPECRFYQAATSEMFGGIQGVEPQNEDTPYHPRSPYGVSKLAAFWFVKNYREAYGLKACSGILFNHESKYRGDNFLPKKVCNYVKQFKKNSNRINSQGTYPLTSEDRLKLSISETGGPLQVGNIFAKRDWGWAKEYCIDLDTEILTINGWKHRHNIKIDDIAINYNLETNKWNHSTIHKIVDHKYKGYMYTFTNNEGLTFRCTSGHRMFFKKKTYRHKSWNDLSWKETTAEKIFNMMNNKALRTKYDFSFPGCTGLDKDLMPFNIDENMLILVGFLLTEGCLSLHKGIGKGMQLSVSQHKKKYYTKLKNAILALGLEHSEYSKNGDIDMKEILFNAEARDKILEYFDGFDIHTMPSWMYKLNSEQTNSLFLTMMDGDGCWASSTYVSKRKTLALDFASLASMSGYKTTLHERVPGVWNVYLKSNQQRTQNNFILNATCKETKENTWCIQTTNGTIISRRKDSIFVSGNCEGMYRILHQEEYRKGRWEDITNQETLTYTAHKITKYPSGETVDLGVSGHEFKDYVLGTGTATSIAVFIKRAFEIAGFTGRWIHKTENGIQYPVLGVPNESDTQSENWEFIITTQEESEPGGQKPVQGITAVVINPEFYRPAEVHVLIADATRAKEELGWEASPNSVDLIIKDMLDG